MENRKVLIVEDEGIVGLDIETNLKKHGFEVIASVASGEEAIKKSFELKPDIILMDIMLAGKINGIEAAKGINEFLNIPIVFITSYSTESLINEAIKVNPYGYIIKPFHENDIFTTIEIALHKHYLDLRLRDSKSYLLTVLSSINQGIIVVDNENKIQFMNGFAENLTGWHFKECEGLQIKDIFKITGIQEEEMIPDYTDFIPMKNLNLDVNSHFYLYKKDGKVIPIEEKLNAIRNEKNETIGWVLIFDEITEKLKHEGLIKDYIKTLRKNLNETVDVLSRTIAKRDPYTDTHQKKVAQLSVAIGKKMGVSNDILECLNIAGLLHDIGKIYIPSEILIRPGKLINEEFNLIKTHSEVGYEILKDIDFPWAIADIVWQHHEKLNGSGYPQGLKDNDILLESRIITIADIVESISSHRPYRPSLGIDFALDEIKKNKTILYDEAVVDACIDLFIIDKFQFNI